jgi:hypothetical protein
MLLNNGARGFVDTGDQDRYDECETAVNQVLKNIKQLAPRFKVRFNSDPSYLRTGFYLFYLQRTYLQRVNTMRPSVR